MAWPVPFRNNRPLGSTRTARTQVNIITSRDYSNSLVVVLGSRIWHIYGSTHNTSTFHGSCVLSGSVLTRTDLAFPFPAANVSTCCPSPPLSPSPTDFWFVSTHPPSPPDRTDPHDLTAAASGAEASWELVDLCACVCVCVGKTTRGRTE